MQVKTISNNIKLKMEDWISSISDEDLRKNVRKDTIVTGGCITSLFLNENVNDYDVYIRTYDTLKSIMEYYKQDFSEYNINILEGRHKQQLINAFLLRHPKEKHIERINNQEAVALRNLKEDQIKYFLSTANGGIKINYDTPERSKAISIVSFLNDPIRRFKIDTPYRPVFFSPNAISLSDDLQIIVRFWGKPEVIHTNYDFVHATNYWTFEEGLVTNNLALTSILTKQLIYQGSLYPVTSIIRLKKFISRKWRITAGEIFKMIYQASRLNLTDTDVLEEQLIGMDVAYFGILIEAIRSIDDKSKLIDDYLFSTIDRIFTNAELDSFDDQ